LFALYARKAKAEALDEIHEAVVNLDIPATVLWRMMVAGDIK
jgi:hypothetical protein